jgi:hypothetical protein
MLKRDESENSHKKIKSKVKYIRIKECVNNERDENAKL